MGRQIRNYGFDEQVAKKLREIRTSKKMIKKIVAHQMGMSIMSINNHESGNYPHNLYVMTKYCKLYNITIDEFMEGIDI